MSAPATTARSECHASGPTRWQSDLLGVVEGVVDGDERSARGVEHRGRDRGAVAPGAVHPDLARRHVCDALHQLVQRDVDGPVDAGRVVLVGPAYVEHDHLAVVAHLGEVGEGRRGEGAEPAVAPVLGRAGGVCRGTVDADPDQLPLGRCDVLGVLAEQRERGAPGDQPAEVGREAAVEPEVEGAGRVPGREGGAGAQVDDPLAGLDASPQLGRVGDRRGREVGLARPGAVGRRHVGVVRRPRRRGRRAAPRRRSPRPGSGPGWPASRGRSSRRWRRTGWPSRTSRTRGSGRPRPRRAAGPRGGAPRRAGGGPGRRCARARAGPGARWRRTAGSRRRRRRRARRRSVRT